MKKSLVPWAYSEPDRIHQKQSSFIQELKRDHWETHYLENLSLSLLFYPRNKCHSVHISHYMRLTVAVTQCPVSYPPDGAPRQRCFCVGARDLTP